MNKKKLLALLMALVMTLTLVPVTALADETVMSTQDYETAVANVSAGGTVTLTGDVTYGTDHSVAVWQKGFNLDLGGHTFTTNSEVNWNASNGGYTTSAICFGDNTGDYVNASVRNGTIHTSYGAGIYADGAVTVTLSSLTVAQDSPDHVQSTPEYSSAIRLTSKAKVIVESGTYTGKNAIAVSNSGGEITINNGTFTGDIFFSNSFSSGLTAADKKITINDGTFYGDFVNTNKGTLVIKGGTFDHDPTVYLADDYKAVNNNGTWTVSGKYVAQIGTTKYGTLADAVAAVPENTETTITMIGNEVIPGNAGVTIPANKNIILDLNGNTISNQVNQDTHSQVIKNNGTLTIKDTSNGETGEIFNTIEVGTHPGDWWTTPQYNYTTNVITNQGTLTVESGTLRQTSEGVIAFAVDNLTNGGLYTPVATINGGKLISAKTTVRQFCNSTTKMNSVVMNGGTVQSGRHAFYLQDANNNVNKGTLTINGGVISSTLNALHIEYLTTADFTTVVSGGKFTGNIDLEGTTGDFIDISGGYFTADPAAYVVEGKTAVASDLEEYDYMIGSIYVAQIGEAKYATLQAAFDAAGSSATEIVMIADTAEDAVVSAGKNITLNLNGHNIVGAQHAITNNGTLVINDSEDKGCVYTTDLSAQGMAAVLNNETGNLTINAGWFGDKDNNKTNANGVQRGNAVRNWGTATITGGHYTACDNFTNNGYAYAIGTGGNNKSGSMTINNADVYGKMNGGIAADSGELVVNGGTFVLTSNNNYRAVWITNDGGNTSVTINDGTFVGKVAALGASIDDNKQDRSDVAISIRGGRFEALDNNAPSVSVSKSNSQYDWTTSITGGKFSTNPSAYVADGYEAVQLTSGEYNGWWQVGIVKSTASASGEIATSPSSINFTVDTAVKESNDVNAGTLAERNDLTVTVSGTTEETTAADAPSVAVAALSNIKDDATLQAIVENAVEKASSKITNNGDNVNVVIQVAKSAPTTEEGKVSYEVHPEAVISVNNVKVGTVDLKNDQIKGTFTFKLNVSSIAHEGDYVRIDHMENNAVLDSKTYRVGEGDCVEITGITRFSIFVGERVDEQNASFTYLGASVRRRVQTSSRNIVVNTCTDMRFGFVVKNYSPSSSYDKYYFQWKKEGGNWSSPVEIINFDHTGGECVASLVITNIPQNFFDTKITAMIYKEGEAGSALEGDAMSVKQVANAIITKYGNGTSQKQWVDYAKYLTTQSGSYTVTYDENDHVSGYNYTA